jgi:hypothetical protein
MIHPVVMTGAPPCTGEAITRTGDGNSSEK